MDGVAQAFRVPADQGVRALDHGDGAFRVVAERQAGDLQPGGLLLHAARVGDHHRRRPLQGQEVEVAQRIQQPQPGGTPAPGLQAGAAPRVDGEHHREARRELGQHAEDTLEHFRVVDGRRAVQRDQDVGCAGRDAEAPQHGAGVRAGEQPRERVDHDVAHPVDAGGRNAFPHEVLVGVEGRGEQPVGHPVGQLPVELLRHRPVVGAQPGFDVGHGHLPPGRGQRARQRRVHIAVHHADVRPVAVEERVEADQDAAGLHARRVRADRQVDVGLGRSSSPKMASDISRS